MRSGPVERRWQRWTEAEARSALKDLSESGTSVAEYARRRGLSTQRLAYWRKRLESAPPAFVAVSLASTPSPRHVEIAAGSVVGRVREDVDVERLAEIAAALSRRVSEC